jgi:hypothetical protein
MTRSGSRSAASKSDVASRFQKDKAVARGTHLKRLIEEYHASGDADLVWMLLRDVALGRHPEMGEGLPKLRLQMEALPYLLNRAYGAPGAESSAERSDEKAEQKSLEELRSDRDRLLAEMGFVPIGDVPGFQQVAEIGGHQKEAKKTIGRPSRE